MDHAAPPRRRSPRLSAQAESGKPGTAAEDVAAAEQDTAGVARSAAQEASANVPSRSRSQARRRVEKATLYNFHALPDYLKDNEFIRSNYRANLSLKDTLKSLLWLHNETGNVWTHLLGFLLFVCLTVYIAQRPPTPLGLAVPQLDRLLDSLGSGVQSLTDNVGHNLQQLQGSVRLPSLHTLHGNLRQLQDSVQHRVHDLQGNLVVLQESLHHKVHGLQEELHHTAQALAGNLHNIQDKIVHSLEDPVVHTAQALRDRLQVIGHNLHAVTDTLHAAAVDQLSSVLHWPVARWPTYVFMAGAMVCLLTSSVCHLLGCCSRHIAKTVWQFDYSAIAVLIVASFFPPVYYGFLCQPFWRMFYLTSTTALGACTVAVSLMPRFQTARWRPVRASMYAGLGLWGLVPVVHQWFLHSHVWAVRHSLLLDLVMGAVYLSGAAIYAMRIPERWLPGKFDMAFNSHQIFHVAVVIGCLVHYRAVELLLEWRDASGGCAAPIAEGPTRDVLRGMQDAGDTLLGIEQVWDRLRNYTMALAPSGHA